MAQFVDAVTELLDRFRGDRNEEDSIPDPRKYTSKAEFVADTKVQPAEYVRRYLDANDGRAYQQALVSHSGWSESSISLLLTDLEESGEVERVKVGRRNIVALPGQLPEDASERSDRR